MWRKGAVFPLASGRATLRRRRGMTAFRAKHFLRTAEKTISGFQQQKPATIGFNGGNRRFTFDYTGEFPLPPLRKRRVSSGFSTFNR